MSCHAVIIHRLLLCLGVLDFVDRAFDGLLELFTCRIGDNPHVFLLRRGHLHAGAHPRLDDTRDGIPSEHGL